MEDKNLIELFPEEKIGSRVRLSNRASTVEDSLINEKYQLGQVRLITEQARYPLNTIVGLVESDRYILNPDFQRRHRWSNAKKSKLIESLLMNIPIPPIFLYEVDYSVFQVMDGLQRLTAITQFYRNEFAIEGLFEWPELNGRTYSTLPNQIKSGIDRRYLSSIIILRETANDATEAERLKQLVFERLNSGGEDLTAQESRNAIYDGPLNKLCLKLARDSNFCFLWGIPAPVGDETKGDLPAELMRNSLFQRMEDAELVLRYFAYRQIEMWEGSIERFFDAYLQHGNQYSPELLESLEHTFSDVVGLIAVIFGKRALKVYRKRKFRQPSRESWEYFNRPAKSVYDAIMYSITLLLPYRKELLANASIIRDSMPLFYELNYHYFEGRNTNKSDVLERMNKLYMHIKRFVE